MSDQTTSDEQSEASTTDTTTADGANDHDQDHDCQQHLEFVNYEWVESAYDDIYECSVCEKEYRMVYEKAFLLDGEDFSLVEEYTDEIKRELERLRDHSETGEDEANT